MALSTYKLFTINQKPAISGIVKNIISAMKYKDFFIIWYLLIC
jgi:hypothetical protein